jgi:transposase-like protein
MARKPSKPITDAERAQIIEAVNAGETRNDIARKMKRSPSSVSKIAHAAGLGFDRSKTAAATKAKQADNRERRARIASQMLDDVEKLQSQMFAPTLVYNFGGRDNTYNEHKLDQPSFRDKRDLATSIRQLMTTVLDTERIDQPQAGHGVMEQLVDAIAKARAAA